MPCVEKCRCTLCRELGEHEILASSNKKMSDENFILSKRKSDEPTNKHKSVIYISGSAGKNKNKGKEMTEEFEDIDECTTLTRNRGEKRSGGPVINVIFRNSFANTQEIIDSINRETNVEDNLPLGMEANDLKELCSEEGVSGNLCDHATVRVNTPANLIPFRDKRMIPERDTGPSQQQQQQKHHQQQHHQQQSSSDDNRSSGHASMSDTCNSNSSPREKAARARGRHRVVGGIGGKTPWTGGGGLEDIKMAIQQLTMRSGTSTSTYSYSSVSAGSESSEPTVRRLMRHSSLETINTNVTSADEFVWVDSHNRLVEVQQLPWTQQCILRVLQTGRCREHMSRVSVESIPRLSYLLGRALVRVGREAQRLSSATGLCSKHEVTVSLRIVLCPSLSESCVKACLRAGAMLAVSGDGPATLRQSKSARAGLQLQVGRFHRWMSDVRLGRFVHEYAAVYLCAGFENLLEEILLQCLPGDPDVTLTATLLEHAIANNGDLWGLLQPYAHLNAGRVASGALALPRWSSTNSLSGKGTISSNGSSSGNGGEPALLTTCVGSLRELQELVGRVRPRVPLSSGGVRALFYFMRCSQLEQGGAVQELSYERAYVVLPPLGEWLRVAAAHGEHRHAALLDRDDVLQAARLLLPGVDCPPRPLGDETVRVRCAATATEEDAVEAARQLQLELAFRLAATGRPELLRQATTMLPATTGLDTMDARGHTPLMLAAVEGDERRAAALLDAGASVNSETPGVTSCAHPAVNLETQHWTALTYAASLGHAGCVRLLLERGADPEGGALPAEERCTMTPLQLASGAGHAEVASLLLAHGAHPLLATTRPKDSPCYSGSAQRGCYSPVAAAAAHGRRALLQRLLAQPAPPPGVLSLEEMLAEGSSAPPPTPRTHLKPLQEAAYHAAEHGHLDVAMDLRALGVPWTLHCWMLALASAHEGRADAVIDRLLQDFLQVCPDDGGRRLADDCLPLLFGIFRASKKEGTTLLLADIFSSCFGWEPIQTPAPPADAQPPDATRIDPNYVNNPELSDVTFRVEGRLFYGHKIVLVTASPRLRAMLASKLCDSGPPTVQINDIRYHIFRLVMQFLYRGGCRTLDAPDEDVVELMAAAHFFQLDALLHYCEARAARTLSLDNVVSMYIHAKVYGASRLLDYCRAFLLQNMVALLTYDDSVKRLLFAKKLADHDVLAGLLRTLQDRVRARTAPK